MSSFVIEIYINKFSQQSTAETSINLVGGPKYLLSFRMVHSLCPKDTMLVVHSGLDNKWVPIANEYANVAWELSDSDK